MSSLQQYLEELSTGQLVTLLRNYCEGRGDLHADVALAICAVLAENDPQNPDVYASFRRFCSTFLP